MDESDLQDMFEEFYRLHRQHSAILAWQLGDWFEFYFGDAVQVSRILNIELTSRGKRVTGEPIPMCAVPADQGFTVEGDCLLVPLAPTEHYFGSIVKHGVPLAVAVAVQPATYPHEHRVAALFNPGDFVRPAVEGLISLVGPEPQLKPVAVR